MNKDYLDISSEKFEFVQQNEKIYDEKFETKPIGYFKDAWIRFRKSLGSVIAGCVLLVLILFAIFGPLFTQFDLKFAEPYFSNALPKNNFFAQFGFWDGTDVIEMNDKAYKFYTEKIPQTKYIVEELRTFEKLDPKGVVLTYHVVKIDSYKNKGFTYELLTAEELLDLQLYQERTGVQIMYPLLKDWVDGNDADSCNEKVCSTDAAELFLSKGQPVYFADRSGKGIQYQVRVLNYEYFTYTHGYEPSFLFGSNSHGNDIFIRLAMGARLSFLLGLAVAIINVTIGLIFGAIEGYYGGTVDLLLERFIEILAGLPFVVIVSLFQLHLAQKVGVIVSLLFAYVTTGWIGTAATVRQQFYRYKNREYVLAARTLGARDARLIFRHILPNAIGPLVTSTVLVIPFVIFNESMLSFLNIINLSTTGLSSIGTMLADGQDHMRTTPHIIMFPAIFISILMISFNVFGNGLRDAFNPSLRGVEE